MEAKIERLATKYATMLVDTRSGKVAEVNPIEYDAFIEGAATQKRITVKKACKVFCQKVCMFCPGDMPCKKLEDFKELIEEEELWNIE